MKQSLLCAALLCSAAVSFAQAPARPDDTRKADPAAKANPLDGTWTVVCIEKNGEAMKDAKDMTVTVKDNTVTCSGKDGKSAMTVKFEFTGPGQAKVTTTDGAATTGTDRKEDAKAATKAAVYVLTKDYLAVCVHDDKGSGTDKPGDPARGGSGAITTAAPTSKSACSIILKRAEPK